MLVSFTGQAKDRIINCCILSKETELFTHRTLNNWGDWTISLLPYHKDLSAQYAIVVTSCIMTAIVNCGFVGAYYINRTMTKISIISTVVVMILFSALLIGEGVNKDSILETTYKTVYTAFLENQYGTKWNFGIFDHIVDHVQQSNKCCGLRKSLNKSQITHPSYYTTLFWLESTNWGQIEQMKIGYNDMNHVPYVPLSCCINRSVENCNFALFGDRYEWNEQLDKIWKERIFIENCDDHITNLYKFIPFSSPQFLITMIVTLCITITNIYFCFIH
ncbi:Cationic amino acid transporter [Trichinella pseudospiralis]